jgi:sugar lactone lactonase YvrE
LWWVDIKRDELHSLDVGTGATQTRACPATLSAVWPMDGDALMCAARRGFATWDLTSGEFTYIAEPEPHEPGNRFNDAVADPAGRFWAGSMDDAEQRASGALYRLDHDGLCTRLFDGLNTPNSLSWSPDGTVMYFTDSRQREIVTFEFDAGSGTLGERRHFASVSNASPDGSTVDEDGCLWNAEWGGWRVVRYRPDGEIDRVVELPVARPTKPAFGGADLSILYVTSARKGLSDSDLARQPLAGSLFALDVGVCGTPLPLCRLDR